MSVSYLRQVSSTFSDDFAINPSLASVQAASGDLILVFYAYRANYNAATITAPLWNGQSFTPLITETNIPTPENVCSVKCFYAFAASSGTYNLTATNDTYVVTSAAALVFSGVNQSTPFGTVQYQNGYTPYTEPSLTVTSVNAEDLVVNILQALGYDSGFGTGPSTVVYTPNGGQTNVVSLTNTGNPHVGKTLVSYKTGTGSVSVGYTRPSTEPMYGNFAVRLIAAGGGGGVSVDTYPATVRSGSIGNAYTTTGLSSVSGINIGTLAATSISDTSGDGTHSVPSLTDGVAHELYGTKTVTITGTGGSPTTTTSFQPLSTQSFVTLSGTLNTTNTGALYNFSPAAVVGDQIIYTTSTVTIDAQGNITTDFEGAQTLWHIEAATKTARSYTLTTGVSGLTATVTGVSVTTEVGTLSAVLGGTTLVANVTGQAASTSVGTLSAVLGGAPDLVATVTGQAATTAVGTISVTLGGATLNATVTGVSAATGFGSLTATLTEYVETVFNSDTLPKLINKMVKPFRKSIRKLFRKK